VLGEHQEVAVELAIELLHSRGAALLADEPGMGKSFVAAEVMRRCDRDVELVIPAALRTQWVETLSRFGVTATLLTHDGVGSADRELPSERRLVVVDEAHAFRNPRTRRYGALARRLIGARVLLVTATPICNTVADLEALFRLMARDDLLAGAGVPSIDAAFERRDARAIEVIVASLVIRRDRSVLPAGLQFGTLRRQVVRHPVPPAPEIDQLRFPLIGEYAILRRFLRRRLESSEAALIESIRRQLRFYERALSAMTAGRTLPKREYRDVFGHEQDAGSFQEILFWDLFAPEGDCDPAAVRKEMTLLDALLASLLTSSCEKRELAVSLVKEAAEPLLIFTGCAATARDLYEALSPIRLAGLVTSRERSRASVLSAFTSGRLDVVITTDLSAEGLNLQRAGIVVHYDIPWNPVKLDQRNGRAHRIGQLRDEVQAIYFLPESRETGIAATVARKNRLRRRMLDRQPVSCTAAVLPTLPPRVTACSAYARARDVQPGLPDILARRHRAGIESLLGDLAQDGSRAEALARLLVLVAAEP
jgi:superfamily II DNA or RNA helicase